MTESLPGQNNASIVVAPSGELSTDLAQLVENAKGFIFASKSAATRKAYASAWRLFEAWASEKGLKALPAEPGTVILYLTHLAQMNRKPATLDKALAAISFVHQSQGHPIPKDFYTKQTMKGIRRVVGSKQRQVKPITADILKRMVASLPETLPGARTKALLLLGFAGAFRRSEVVSLDVADLEFDPRGLICNLARSKTDQEGRGARVAISRGSEGMDPIEAVQAWLAMARITEGAVFRSFDFFGNLTDRRLDPQSVAWLIHRIAYRIGEEPRDFSGHSLRAGFATSAVRAKKDLFAIKKQTRHASLEMLDRYVRSESIFEDHAGDDLL